MRSSGRRLTLALVVLVLGGWHGAAVSARELTAGATGEASLAQPMVTITIDGDRRAAAAARRDDDLADLTADLPAVAVLDTGASSHVLSSETAGRFGVQAEPGARYVEVGMGGDHAMAVSRAVTLLVSDLEPEVDDDQRARAHRTPAAVRVAAQRLLLNEAPADLAAALLSPGSMVDVIGMPVIRDRVVEIAPGDADLPAVAVRLHPSAAGLDVDTWVALTLVDFNRPHPRNRGPRPVLATNPVLGVRAVAGATHANGDWLLDTGAACSMVSTATARRLGLVDADGRPTRPPAFTLPIGGIGGGQQTLPGFRLDGLELSTEDGRTLVFPRPAVVVHDVTAERADGRTVTLDGILGMNLLLPSGNGMTMLGSAEQLASPFDRIVIDVAHERLGFALRR